MRRVTVKSVQTHFQCACGLNIVDHEDMQVRWKDFSKLGIVRTIDKTTGKPFLFQRIVSNVCNCDPLND
jgi:hypothetical protein